MQFIKHAKFYKAAKRYKNMKGMFGLILAGILLLSCVSGQITGAAIVIDADYVTVFPGEEGSIDIDVENTNNYEIQDISVSVVLDGLPFTSVGSSQKDIDEIDDDDSESVSFDLKASTDAAPGDYNIPYVITYIDSSTDENVEKTGSFGMRISAKTEIDFSVETKDAIVGNTGKVSLNIINRGLGEIRALSVELIPNGFELLSNENEYVGTIDADSDELVTFDVIFKSKSATLNAKIEYKDFENKDKTETVNLPLKVYDREEALKLGLVKNPNYTPYIIVIALIIAWFVWRKIKKARRRKKEGR